jgi:hypothetical protein
MHSVLLSPSTRERPHPMLPRSRPAHAPVPDTAPGVTEGYHGPAARARRVQGGGHPRRGGETNEASPHPLFLPRDEAKSPGHPLIPRAGLSRTSGYLLDDFAGGIIRASRQARSSYRASRTNRQPRADFGPLICPFSTEGTHGAKMPGSGVIPDQCRFSYDRDGWNGVRSGRVDQTGRLRVPTKPPLFGLVEHGEELLSPG